jgi:hypothetical protein
MSSLPRKYRTFAREQLNRHLAVTGSCWRIEELAQPRRQKPKLTLVAWQAPRRWPDARAAAPGGDLCGATSSGATASLQPP